MDRSDRALRCAHFQPQAQMWPAPHARANWLAVQMPGENLISPICPRIEGDLVDVMFSITWFSFLQIISITSFLRSYFLCILQWSSCTPACCRFIGHRCSPNLTQPSLTVGVGCTPNRQIFHLLSCKVLARKLAIWVWNGSGFTTCVSTILRQPKSRNPSTLRSVFSREVLHVWRIWEMSSLSLKRRILKFLKSSCKILGGCAGCGLSLSSSH